MVNHAQNTHFPLAMASVGQAVRLIHIDAGKKLTHRLNELGLTPGVELIIVQAAGGPLLVAVRDSRVALGRGMAHKILVTHAELNDVPKQSGVGTVQ
ncbi:MAG: ferrous iron transport protein A [Anaerolineales bacterium]|nr:ferrous iron transport protein A [Anaerolineales bacterium]